MHFRGGDAHRPVLIHPARWLSSHIDPTYDGIDAEADHFFLFVRQHLPIAERRQYFIEKSTTDHEKNAA
jgi:hypothetical protein